MTQKGNINPPSEGYVVLPDGNLFYVSQGEGFPVILVHSISGGAWKWERMMEPLAEQLRVYAVDLPGHHRSERPPKPYTVEDFATMLMRFMDSLGISKAHLVGTHGGAIISLAFAVTNPTRIEKLVLNGCPSWTLEQGREYHKRDWLEGRCDERGLPLPMTLERAKGTMMINPDQRMVDLTNKAFLESGEWLTQCHAAVSDYDVVAHLPAVQASTLITYGEMDKRKKERALYNGIKGSRLEIVPSSAASPFYEQPKFYSRVLMEFLTLPEKY